MLFLRAYLQYLMQIISRKDALASHIGQYFTGKPCKKGHTTYRYSASGACAACVAVAASASRGLQHSGVPVPRAQTEAATTDKINASIAARQAKLDALNALVEIKVPIHVSQLDTVFNTAVQLCLAEYPALTRADVWPSSQPVRNTPLYKIRVPTKHIELMRGIADTFWSPYKPNVEQIRADALAAVSAMMEAASDTPPEGTT